MRLGLGLARVGHLRLLACSNLSYSGLDYLHGSLVKQNSGTEIQPLDGDSEIFKSLRYTTACTLCIFTVSQKPPDFLRFYRFLCKRVDAKTAPRPRTLVLTLHIILTNQLFNSRNQNSSES